MAITPRKLSKKDIKELKIIFFIGDDSKLYRKPNIEIKSKYLKFKRNHYQSLHILYFLSRGRWPKKPLYFKDKNGLNVRFDNITTKSTNGPRIYKSVLERVSV